MYRVLENMQLSILVVSFKMSIFLNDMIIYKKLLGEVSREKKVVKYFNTEREIDLLTNIESEHLE